MACTSHLEFHVVATTMFELEKNSYANSTIKSWESKLKRILLFFGNKPVDQIVRSDILRYLEVHRELKNKTLNEDLTLLRKVFRFAIGDRLIPSSPMADIENLKVGPTACEPFSLSELEALTMQNAECESVKNGILLSCYVGLRKSEWIALVVEDYDPASGTLSIERACVLEQMKRPKTKGSTRIVQLPDVARQILNKQLKLISSFSEQTISIQEDDIKTLTRLTAQPLFPNLRNGKFYSAEKEIDRVYKNWLTASGVSYRGPKQARHTYASHAIMAGANLYWIASQLGHNTLDMIYKHYSKWIKEDSVNYPQLIDQHFQCVKDLNSTAFPPPINHLFYCPSSVFLGGTSKDDVFVTKYAFATLLLRKR